MRNAGLKTSEGAARRSAVHEPPDATPDMEASLAALPDRHQPAEPAGPAPGASDQGRPGHLATHPVSSLPADSYQGSPGRAPASRAAQPISTAPASSHQGSPLQESAAADCSPSLDAASLSSRTASTASTPRMVGTAHAAEDSSQQASSCSGSDPGSPAASSTRQAEAGPAAPAVRFSVRTGSPSPQHRASQSMPSTPAAGDMQGSHHLHTVHLARPRSAGPSAQPHQHRHRAPQHPVSDDAGSGPPAGLQSAGQQSSVSLAASSRPASAGSSWTQASPSEQQAAAGADLADASTGVKRRIEGGCRPPEQAATETQAAGQGMAHAPHRGHSW